MRSESQNTSLDVNESLQWIPVTDERKPENQQPVLIVIDMRDEYRDEPDYSEEMNYFTSTGWYSAERDAFGDDNDPCNGRYVTHWLPIPPLPGAEH